MRIISLGGIAARGTRARSGTQGLTHAWPGTLATSLLLTGAFALVRIPLALTSILSETYYDEALTGLMGLEILRGVPQVFYWGEPYGGAIGDAYPAAVGFWLFGPSTLVLRLSPLVVIVASVWVAWQTAQRVAGDAFGLWAGLYMAIPPVFVSYIQLSSPGEALAVACGAVVMAATIWLLDPAVRARTAIVAGLILGLAAGVGWWSSQIMGMFVVTAVLVLAVTQTRAWRTVGPYVALGLFVLASLPLWVWNLQHDWATFRHLSTWGGGPPPLLEAIPSVARTLMATLRDQYWDGRGHTVWLPPAGRLAGQALMLAVYAPAVGLAAFQVGVWGRRAWRRERPWREPLDVVVLAFWLTAAAHASTWFGTSGVLRYSITFYVTLPVLCAALLARVARLGHAGPWVAAGLAAALLAYNGATHVAFVEGSRAVPWRPVDAVIARLGELGVRACYADGRVAQVVTFESAGRIQCVDYLGYRNFGALQAVDAIEDPTSVAIVLRPVLRDQRPAVMADTLALLGATAQREVVGEYEIFHHVGMPDARVRPVPTTGWRARGSSDAEPAALVLDRQAWTRWSAPKQPGEWLELDLGTARPITQVSLLPGPWIADAPAGLRIETSLDGQRWETAATSRELYPGLHEWKGHPRVDDSGRVIARFPPRSARHVRLTSLGATEAGARWSVAELFVYEPAPAPWAPPREATGSLAAAAQGLDRWMDDPTGPHPLRAPMTAAHRRAQVPWGATFAAVNDALAAAPDWEAAHQLYGRALARAGWGAGPELALDQARRDGAWLEVLRIAALIDQRPEPEWRAGRVTAQVEALRQLGRPAEAAVVEARAEPVPDRRVRVQFGRSLELVGVDIPQQARPGETVRVGYHWRLLNPSAYDYWVFLHVRGLPRNDNHDQPVGADRYTVSQWAPAEQVFQTVAVTVPQDAPAGRYSLRVGVWLPPTGRRLHVLSSDLPQGRRGVMIGTLNVVR